MGGVIGNGSVDADDSLLEEAREDVVGSLSSRRVLDHHWYQTVRPRSISKSTTARDSTPQLLAHTIGNQAPHGSSTQERSWNCEMRYV